MLLTTKCMPQIYVCQYLVNEGIGLILVIHTFYPFSVYCSVLYNKDVYLTSSIV